MHFFSASDFSEYCGLFSAVFQAVLWNMETFQTQYTAEEHAVIITDVRFRPNSNQLATSSFDRTIKLWNAADVSHDFSCVCESGKEITQLCLELCCP